jgi:hypothetical protein
MLDEREAFWREYERQRRESQEQQSAEHFANPDATIPDLEFSTPDCPICYRATDFDDGFSCDVCKVTWPSNGYGHDATRWSDE